MLWGFHCSKINTLGPWVAGVWCSCGSTMATPIGTSPEWILGVPGLSLGPRLSLASRGWTLGVPKSVLGDPGWVHPTLFCPTICVEAHASSGLCISVVLKQSCQLGAGGEQSGHRIWGAGVSTVSELGINSPPSKSYWGAGSRSGPEGHRTGFILPRPAWHSRLACLASTPQPHIWVSKSASCYQYTFQVCHTGVGSRKMWPVSCPSFP